MSKAVKSVVNFATLGVLDKGGKKGAPSEPTPAERARSHELETREAQLLAQARAGGAVRPENEADLLGSAPQTKRRRASRQLLG